MTKPKPTGTTRLIEARRRCHGVNEKLVVTLLPDGTLKVREQGRRVAVVLDVATLYVRALIAQVKVKQPRRRRQRLF
jgi:hypothetical protein